MTQLPIPHHFQPATVGENWRVPYQDRSSAARLWAKQHQLIPTAQTQSNIKLLLIDVQKIPSAYQNLSCLSVVEVDGARSRITFGCVSLFTAI